MQFFALVLTKLSPLFIFAAGSSTTQTCTMARPFFFFFPPWWEYLTKGTPDALGQCSPTVVLPGDLWAIGLAILDMMLRVAGFAALVSLMIAGVDDIFSGGDPQKASAARWRMYNSFIGLGISIIAVALVSFIGKALS